MKIMLKTRKYDRCGDYYDYTPEKQPHEKAYQDTYIVVEHCDLRAVELTTIYHEKEIAGETYVRKEEVVTTHPMVEEWLEKGYDHTFGDEKPAYHHHGRRILATRRIEKPGWFIDLTTLEEFIEFVKDYALDDEIQWGYDYDLQEDFVILVV